MWKITKNYQEETLYTSSNFKEDVELKHKFKIYDDDGELYCEGLSDDDCSFDPLDDYGMPSLGATEIHYLNPKTGHYDVL